MKKILLLILLVGIHLTSFGQVQFWSDDFENATAPSSGTRSPSYNGGVGGTPFIAYFLRTQGNNIDLDPSLSDGPYSNVQGSWFWAGEDHDAFGNAEQTIVWSGIDISGKNNITFQGLFAAQSTYAAWESILFGFSHDDYVTVEYSIDGAAYQKLIDFRANSGAQPPGPDIILNQYKQLADDTNFDGIGNGTVLTKAFNEFTKTIPGSGSTLSLRLRASSNNSYTEEWAIDNFRLLATAANSAPVATAPSAPSVTEDAINVALANNIQVNDADGDNQTVTFTVTGGTVSLGTTGITFGGGGNGSANFTASGTLANINAALDAATFTPTPNLFGTNAGTISFFSNDGTVNSNTATVSFDIAGVNDPPNITGLPSTITVTEDATEDPLDISSATISDIDAGSGELTLKLEATGGIFDYAAGPGITLTGQLTNEATFTGNLTDLNNYINIPSNIYFRPDANLSGNGAASVNVSINDNGNTGSGGGTDIPVGTISVNITPVNDAPTDILLDNNSVAENETIGTVVGLFSALDVDNGDTFTFTLVSGTGDTDNSVFSISGNELRTAAVFDFETKNSYSIRVRVTDSGGLTFEKPFTATVDEVNESPSEILLDNSSVAENEATGTTVGTFSAVDPNAGDTFVYTFADGAGDEDNDSFTLTGDELLTGEVFDFETKNSYSIRVRVTDSGGLFLELPFSISITDVNEAPTVVNPIPNQNIDQGEELSFQFAINTFHDVDGDDLTYSAQLSGGGALPAWLSFNPANRTFSGTPLNSHVGTVSIDVTADDENGGAITDTFNITVANVNDAPTVTNTIPNQNATEDLAFSFQFASNTFSDIDVGDVLTYSAEQTGGDPLPAWLDFDPLTRTFSGTPSNLDVGNITIEVTAADMSNASVSTSFTLTVLNVNDAPTVANPIDNQNATQDVLFEFVVPANTFEDIDGDDLTYSAQLAGGGALPAWLSFNPANRTFNGTPLNAHVGTLSIDVIANDGNGESAIDTFDLVVANVNDAPTVANPIPNQDATEGVVFSFQFASNTFSDIDVGDVLTYSAEQTGGDPLPAWLDFDPLTRTFSGTPGNDDTGLITIEVIANDGNGGTVYDSFELSIQGVNDAPVITAPLTISVFEDEPEALTGISFTDVDAGSSDVQATFEVGSGTLSAISGNGVTVGGTSTSLILEGSLSDINAFISNGELTFTTALNATSDVNLNISITDNGNTGSGGSLTDQTNVTLTVTAVNDAPVNTVPGTQQTDQDAALVFSSGNGNLFSVSDVDAGSNDIQITLTAANGLISLSGTGGLTFTQGSGVNDGTMVFVGTIVDINTALDGLIFSPIAGFNGLASLSITSNDQGFSGSGGVQTDTDVVSITVNSVNPIVTLVTSSAVNGIYKVGDELSILVDFDQAVTVNTAVGEPTLTLETGGTDREVSYISGSGSSSLVFNYTVQPGDVSSDLDYTSTNALVLNGATIENSSGDAAIISLPPVGSPNSISGQKDIQIDGVIPVIASVSVPADQTYVAGETLEFTVNFSEAVVVTGNPQISISIGAQTQQAVFVSGSGSSALVFSYTVQSGDLDDNGIVIGSLSLNGGTIRDAAGNNANLTLNSVGVTDQVLVDAVAPSGYAVSFELGSQSIINTSNVETVAFEGSPLEIGTTLSYEFSSSTSGAPITGTASVSSETQVFDNAGSGYDLTSLGDGTITLTVSLTDAAGNVGVDATTTVTKDATAPTGYAVAWDDLLINAIESSNTSFTLSNAEVNTVADYSISSSGDGNTATITGSLSVTSAVQQIPVDVSTLTDGVLTVEVTLTDEGDNEGGIVSANNATLDQTAPASPSTPDLTDASDTGVSNTDNITADNTPTFAGTAEANATVEVFGDGSSLGTTTADGSGYWDFTSALMVDGTYAITATATDAAGNVSLPSAALSITIDQNECNAQADFIFSPTEGCTAPMTVFFTDQSISADVWAWDFGDGSSSTAQNPIHSYTTYGDFTVKLTVTDTEYGCSSTIEKVFSNYELSADFNANVAFGCGPLEVGFEDLSVGAESWNWDFGDGNTSTDQNPTHIYEQPGNYAVVLTTTGGACSKTITKNNYIQVIGSDVDFSTDITEGCGPLTVAFTNLSTYSSPPISFLWDFGDGSTSTLQNPTHDYASAGTYTVKLTVNDLDGCSRTLTKTGLIQVNLLDVSISKTDVTCDGGFDGSITVTPNEGLAPFTYEWSNGASTAEISGISAGNYSVIITDANGCSVTKSVEITEPIPAVLSTSNPSSISHSSAELGGELLGGLDCAQETGIVYATISNPDISDTKVIMTLTGNIFSEVVSGLQVNTSYYARAYSTNQNGITTYSNEVVFTTSKKILEITAVAGQSKFYGEADPVFTYTATGFEGGDDESVLTGALERVAGENVGSYAIQQGTLDAGDNYTIDFTSADFEVIPTDITGITFDDGSFTFDGTEKTIETTGTLPAGTSVAYSDNTRTNVGTQEATATITGANFTTLVLTADLTITPADVSEITFEDASFVYDGTAKSLAITGTLPAGTSV
ncbi:putative Ig domain-containing protein, partial [Algoriphagus sp.]|uniref:putative Ig domain-containing protein n=1 Tax=Algoriphagus sp. TaxID=1872435 RepID=UPI003F6E94AD